MKEKGYEKPQILETMPIEEALMDQGRFGGEKMIQKPYPWVDSIKGVKELGEKGEAIIYNAPQGEAYRINATALDVLRLCDGERTVDEIIEKMAELYDVSIDILEKDVREIIEKFAELKVIGSGPFHG